MTGMGVRPNGDVLGSASSTDHLYLLDLTDASDTTDLGAYPTGVDSPRSLAVTLADEVYIADSGGVESLWRIDPDDPGS